MIVKTETQPHRLSTGLCRVSIRAGTAQADLALSPDIPVAEMIPSVYDIFAGAGAALPASPCSLHQAGRPALDLSMSLSQSGIADGALLILAPEAQAPPAVAVMHAADAAEHVASADRSAWTWAQSRLAALLITVTLAATAGLVVVPGGIGAPSLLLAAAAATAAAAVGARTTRNGRTALMAVTAMAALSTITTFGATLFDFGASATGVTLAVLAVGVLSVPGRLALLISGLSAFVGSDLDPHTDGPNRDIWLRSRRAQQVLTALVLGAAAAAALGSTAVTFGTNRQFADFLLTATLAALLTIRSRVHDHPVRRSALLAAGLLCTTTLLIGLRLAHPGFLPWLCVAAATLVAGALWLGLGSRPATGAAPMRRWLDLLDSLLLLAVIPLACWSSGLYDIARGLSL